MRLPRYNFLFLAPLLLLGTGCFPYGLPEAPSQVRSGGASPGLTGRFSPPRPPDVLLVSRCAEELSPEAFRANRAERLGHQFIIGIIPLTSLYLQHGSRCALEEAALEFFARQGLSAVTIGAQDLPNWQSAVHPRTALSLELLDFSVNAYDLLLIRRLVISGVLRGRQLDLNGSTIAELSAPLNHAEFALHGQAARLSGNIHRAFQGALSALSARLLPGSRLRQSVATSAAGSRKILALALPNVPQDLVFARVLAQSYGVPDYAPFSPSAAARIIQRAIHAGLPGLSVGSVYGDAFAPRNGWMLQTNVTSLAAATDPMAANSVPGLQAVFEFSLRQGSLPLKRARCSIWESLETKFDGAWVIALERASQTAVERFMGEADPRSTSCNPF